MMTSDGMAAGVGGIATGAVNLLVEAMVQRASAMVREESLCEWMLRLLMDELNEETRWG